MIPNHSLAVWLLGVWLGAGILADIAVTQNFQTVDRFLRAPGDAAAEQLNAIGPAQERAILRRNAAEENNWIFTNWERAQLGIGILLLLMLCARGPRRKLTLAAAVLAPAIVAAEHLLLTPRIASLGRVLDGLTPADSRYGTFWMLHGFYSGLDILKILIVFGLAARLVFARASSPTAVRRAVLSPETAHAPETVKHG